MEAKQLLRCLLGILLFSLVGCTTQEYEDSVVTSAPMVNKLKVLPPPQRKVTIAVYAFSDLTGQRKPSDTLSLLSTAVTQGAHVWLIQSLKKAGDGNWFQVIERIGLDNLLKERQIIRNTRKSYEGDDAKKVKPLLFAGVILEASIAILTAYVTDSFRENPASVSNNFVPISKNLNMLIPILVLRIVF